MFLRNHSQGATLDLLFYYDIIVIIDSQIAWLKLPIVQCTDGNDEEVLFPHHWCHIECESVTWGLLAGPAVTYVHLSMCARLNEAGRL